LTSLWVTKPLAGEVDAHPQLVFETGFEPMPCDAAGNLDQERLFPESVRARRRCESGNGHTLAPERPFVLDPRSPQRVEYKL
jgi:hypothetical protein